MTEEQKNNANNWLKELFRRRVVQTIALYIAVAWGATEIFVTVQEVQGWPEWTARLVVAIFITGFPAALVLAWARDISSRALRAVVHVVALSVFAAGSYLVYQQGRPPGPPFASLVVIPFADLSADQEKDWFVTGLSHELRSTLAQVQGLLVIAETSADVFRGRAADVDAIGTELNVRHVLEGVVRRDDDQLRITANLIDTQDGRHVWSKSYNFVAANIFDIQTDISERIAGAFRHLRTRPAAACAAIWASIPARAAASITGPASVESSQGSPRRNSSMAPNSIFSTRSATSLCT